MKLTWASYMELITRTPLKASQGKAVKNGCNSMQKTEGQGYSWDWRRSIMCPHVRNRPPDLEMNHCVYAFSKAFPVDWGQLRTASLPANFSEIRISKYAHKFVLQLEINCGSSGIFALWVFLPLTIGRSIREHLKNTKSIDRGQWSDLGNFDVICFNTKNDG